MVARMPENARPAPVQGKRCGPGRAILAAMSTDLAFSDADWTRLERDWSAWWNRDLARPLLVVQSTAPATRLRPAWWDGRQFGGIPLDVPAEAIAEQAWDDLARTTFHGDAWPKFWTNFGPGAAAAFLGGRLEAAARTTWFHPGRWQGRPLAEIRPEYDAEETWWRRIQAVTSACLARFAGRASVGYTDLGGGLDIAASLRDTQTLLMDCLDDPEAVDGLCAQITPLWLRYYHELTALIAPAGRGTTPWAPIWSPQRCYMLQCDFSYMISPKQFARWVVPDLAACCAQMEHGFYHLDGKGELPHLDHLLAVPGLKGVQWVPGDGNPGPCEAEWLPVQRRIRAAGKLIQTWGPGETVLRLAREVPLDGWVIQTWAEDGDHAGLVAAIQRANAELTAKAMVTVG
jgi:5-methyltetrahydrofolate--homocysteine methyltransferase